MNPFDVDVGSPLSTVFPLFSRSGVSYVIFIDILSAGAASCSCFSVTRPVPSSTV